MSSYRRYNYRAYPTQGQREALSCLYGACRYAYNWTLDQRELMRHRHGRMQSCTQLSNMFTLWKREPGMEWLPAVSATPLQQSIRHADMAYRNFLRLYRAGRTHIVTNRRTGKRHRTGLPRYKSRRDGEQSAEFTKSARFKVEHADGCKWAFLTLPKIGRVKLRWTRELPSTPNTVTIMLHADGSYEASFTVQVEDKTDAPKPLHEACGIDMGLDSLMSIVYTDGTREKIPHPHTLKRKMRRLRKLDKQLAREKERLEQPCEDTTSEGQDLRSDTEPAQGHGVQAGIQGGGREPSRRLGDPERQRTGAHPHGEKPVGRELDANHRPHPTIGRPIRQNRQTHRPLVSQQPNLLPMRTQGWQETVGRTRMGMPAMRHTARP